MRTAKRRIKRVLPRDMVPALWSVTEIISTGPQWATRVLVRKVTSRVLARKVTALSHARERGFGKKSWVGVHGGCLVKARLSIPRNPTVLSDWLSHLLVISRVLFTKRPGDQERTGRETASAAAS